MQVTHFRSTYCKHDFSDATPALEMQMHPSHALASPAFDNCETDGSLEYTVLIHNLLWHFTLPMIKLSLEVQDLTDLVVLMSPMQLFNQRWVLLVLLMGLQIL